MPRSHLTLFRYALAKKSITYTPDWRGLLPKMNEPTRVALLL